MKKNIPMFSRVNVLKMCSLDIFSFRRSSGAGQVVTQISFDSHQDRATPSPNDSQYH